MADERIRELERRAALGDPQAAAQLLRERIRQGEDEPVRLELAATLGDPEIRAALGEDAPVELRFDLSLSDRPADAHPFHKGNLVVDRLAMELLRRFGKEIYLRGLLPLGRAVLPGWRAERVAAVDVVGCQEASEAWLACPCDTHRRAAARAFEPLISQRVRGDAVRPFENDFWIPHMPRSALTVVADTAQLVSMPAKQIQRPWGEEGAGSGEALWVVISASYYCGDPERVWTLIRETLRCWALNLPAPEPDLQVPREPTFLERLRGLFRRP